ncbi:PHA/PHB synthase family protein [Rugamonas aquatica]|uniref:Alpha/beta fold hydrolase n=1 Tax=Rugamonas aquatica TaxID=2743357 RepID=A0A6A7MW39_9BURK|nr:alpha/beta fold hydrolase [Rugamonas aquatica]
MKNAQLKVVPAVPTPAPAAETAPPANALDLYVQSRLARLTGGVSPIAMSLAFQDWWLHLSVSPGTCSELAARWLGGLAAPAPAETGGDSRFDSFAWRQWPFSQYVHGFKQAERFWTQATTGVRGVAPHHAEVVAFSARQLLDMCSPSNFLWTNPEVLRAATASGGRSLLNGALNWRRDLCRHLAPPGMAVPEPAGSSYVPGQDVALTPGEVIYSNELMELIQYAPQTAQVYREPVLIVPSWIMKYYILDLSPHNSLVRYLVQQGHTVLMLSWRNPGQHDRDMGMDDYLQRGVFAALEQADRLGGGEAVHAVGYCLGGTLLAIAAAALDSGEHAPHGKLASVSLLAAQTDFSEPGELGLFIDDSELALLDALMWDQGYLDGDQMAASFQLLHARDLVWSRMMREYLLGERTAPNDLMSWNADSTRLPFRMHSEYLHGLFLHNDLAEGRYRVQGKPVALTGIRTPMFVVGTERDHVSPWRSVYKIHLLSGAAIDFVLASGGHNAGIVSEPGHAGRSYRSRPAGGTGYSSPDEWLAGADRSEGSWWPHWQQWLVRHSVRQRAAPPAMGLGRVLGPAPGHFVLEH